MEPSFDELVHRIETLKREKRRWKLAAIGALVSASAVLLCGGAGSFGVFYLQVRQLRLLALDAEMARLEAERARQEADNARHRAEEERLRREAVERLRPEEAK